MTATHTTTTTPTAAARRHQTQVEIRECVALMDQNPEQEQIYALLGVKSWTRLLLDDLTATGAVAARTVAAADQYGAAAAAVDNWVSRIVLDGPAPAIRSLADAFEDAA